MEFLTNFLDLSHTRANKLISSARSFADIFEKIGEFITSTAAELDEDFIEIYPSVFVHKTAQIAPSAVFGKNVIIGAYTQVRHCAFIRGNAVVGENCVVGNSCEIKNSILFDGVQVPHFNYVGDSILGYRTHLGAGAITSNVKSDKSLVTVFVEGETLTTGLKKLGAIVGDFVEIGCNSVLNPGAVIGKNSTVYPLSCVRGFVPPDSIYKSKSEIIKKSRL